MMTSYIFTFAVLLMVMSNSCQYLLFHRPRKDDFWGQWGPFILLCTATPLLLVSPFKNLVVNVCMQSFRTNGFDSTIEHALDLAYLPIFSTRLLQFYTTFAYVLMFWSTYLQVDMGSKFRILLKAYHAKANVGKAL